MNLTSLGRSNHYKESLKILSNSNVEQDSKE